MNRRALLASAGGSIAALSGCLRFTEDRDDPPTEQPPVDSETPGEDGTPTPAPSVTVESAVQQWGYVTPDSPDSIGVTDTETRYLVAEVTATDGALDRDVFTFTVGSAGAKPTRPERFYRTSWGDEQWYERGRERGLLLFELPDELGSSPPRLVWPGGDWRPGEALVKRLSAPKPSMSASLSVPDAADGSTEKTVEVEVTNAGETEGQYLGALNRVGPMTAYTPVARVTGLVGAGESRTIEIADSWSEYPSAEKRGDGETDVTYRLDDAAGGDSLDVAVGE